MAKSGTLRIARKVRATTFRSHYRRVASGAEGRNVVLIENLRQRPKYLVDKEFLDGLLRERDRILATLEILAEPELASRLVKLGQTVDRQLRTGRITLHTLDEVFG